MVKPMTPPLIPGSIRLKQSPKKPRNPSKDSGSMIPYEAYLRGSNRTGLGPTAGPKEGSRKISIHRKPSKKSLDNMRVIRSKEKPRKSRKQKTTFNRSKDINEIEKQMRIFSDKKVAVTEKAATGTEEKAATGTEKKATVTEKKVSKRSRKRPTKRHKTKGRRIRISRKETKAEDLKQIEQKINSIRNKKPRDIREALLKDGIQVSGKSNRLLQDIYFYSKVCNINIKHEV